MFHSFGAEGILQQKPHQPAKLASDTGGFTFKEDDSRRQRVWASNDCRILKCDPVLRTRFSQFSEIFRQSIGEMVCQE